MSEAEVPGIDRCAAMSGSDNLRRILTCCARKVGRSQRSRSPLMASKRIDTASQLGRARVASWAASLDSLIFNRVPAGQVVNNTRSRIPCPRWPARKLRSALRVFCEPLCRKWHLSWGYIEEGGDIQCVTIRLSHLIFRLLRRASQVLHALVHTRVSTVSTNYFKSSMYFFLDLHSIHHATTPFKFVSACGIVKKLLSRQHGPEYTVQLLENGDMTMEGSIIYHHLHASIAMLLRRSPKPNFQF
ncbi:hypothetical protein C8J57DRAFT_236847 [Mycena rebaudengoi]|nr:hypothetical protein C8J57DRAFT_236847 [Mycena rebaudengoi]